MLICTMFLQRLKEIISTLYESTLELSISESHIINHYEFPSGISVLQTDVSKTCWFTHCKYSIISLQNILKLGLKDIRSLSIFSQYLAADLSSSFLKNYSLIVISVCESLIVLDDSE